MTQITSKINQLKPASITIKVPAGSDSGISDNVSLLYTITDQFYNPGDPDVKIVITLSIVETSKYTFGDGSTQLTLNATMTGGEYDDAFTFQLKNIYVFPANPLPVNLILCAYDKALGVGQQNCAIKQFTVNKA
ncbi:MAG: hypothetical protein JSU01_24010 [Bacteroidetes bacterium]|nr:hypothetical protein [Bacteroidota bacterium]